MKPQKPAFQKQPHLNHSLLLPTCKSVRLIETFSSVLTGLLFWILSSLRTQKSPVKTEKQKREDAGQREKKEKIPTRVWFRRKVLKSCDKLHMFPIISAKYKHLGIALLKLNRNQAVGPRGSLRGSSNRLPPDAAPRRRLCSQKMDKLCTGRTAARRPQIIPDLVPS